MRSAESRVHDFEAVQLPMTPEEAMIEAARCIHCPDPAPCMVACPVDNDIPTAMWLIENGEFLKAAELYRQTSSMPSVCGRVCPHEELCQASCVHVKQHDSVLTGALEAFVSDYQRATTGVKVPVGEATGKKVAIIGAGPAGLAAAEQLVQKGHQCTIFEGQQAPGGLLLYGIPNFKLPKDVVCDRTTELEEAGVEFVYNTFVGKAITIDELLTEHKYDAVFIGVGSQVDAPMKADGVDLQGVYNSTDFLTQSNFVLETIPDQMRENLCLDQIADEIRNRPAIGNKVVVIGGGDTASDCLRLSIRMLADEVTCLYRRTENEMPGSKKDRKLAKEEGAIYRFLTQPVRFLGDENGKLRAVECVQMELGEPDASGRARPIPIEGSNFEVEADTAVLALGYWPDPTIGDTTPDLETHKWGLIVADPETGETSRKAIFAGGDAVTGPSLVVTAMNAGRKAAKQIHRFLTEESEE